MSPSGRLGGGLGALRRFSRTTVVRLSLLYLVVFSVFAVFLVVGITHDAGRILTRQLHDAIDADVTTLQDQYRAFGMVRLVRTVDEYGARPDAGLYAVIDASGNPIAGNVAELPPGAFAEADDDAPHPLRYSRIEEGIEYPRVALVRAFSLDNGFRVLVGRDMGEREKLRSVFRSAFRSIVVLMVVIAGLTWWFLSRRVLKRIDQVSAASRRIVDGDLSGRLPVTGSGDEFDRLALGLNDMLARIAVLMRGVKDVGDAIAHDLKTPLTRLRNRTEAALAGEESVAAYREALEATLDESNGLIRTFDALLTIARLDAGAAVALDERVDLAALVADVAELYEPLAEEAGGVLSVVRPLPAVTIDGRRELLAQVLVNLVDNALKHGRRDDRPPTVRLSLALAGSTARLVVADDGPGIPAEDRERIFERFTRLESSRSTPGSGLGLALVAAVVRLHHGSVRVEDAAPGTRFVVELPICA